MTVKVENNFKYFEFTDKGVEYVIHVTFVADELEKLDLIKLSRVVENNSGVKVPEQTSRTGANITDAVVDRNDGVLKYANSVFIVRVNEYLASQGGEVATFPESGTNFEQWLFLLEKGFSYSNGVVSLSV